MRMDENTLEQRLKDYTFFHTIQLGDGIQTPGKPISRHQEIVLETIAAQDLAGKRVIDIGCANGLFALAAEKQGATDILAVDHTESQLEPLRELLIPYLESKIKVSQQNLLELRASEIGQFDLVIFPGVLYHLRYPFWSLKIVRDLTAEGGLLIIETSVIVDENELAVLWCPSPSDSPYTGRGANACSFFNRKALEETLACLGIEVISLRHSQRANVRKIRQVRRILSRLKQTVVRTIKWKASQSQGPSPTLDRVVLLCRRKAELADPQLQNFYDGLS